MPAAISRWRIPQANVHSQGTPTLQSLAQYRRALARCYAEGTGCSADELGAQLRAVVWPECDSKRRGSIAGGLGSITERQDYFALDRPIPAQGRREPPLPCHFFSGTHQGIARRAGRPQRLDSHYATGLINQNFDPDFHLRNNRSTDCERQIRP